MSACICLCLSGCGVSSHICYRGSALDVCVCVCVCVRVFVKEAMWWRIPAVFSFSWTNNRGLKWTLWALLCGTGGIFTGSTSVLWENEQWRCSHTLFYSFISFTNKHTCTHSHNLSHKHTLTPYLWSMVNATHSLHFLCGQIHMLHTLGLLPKSYQIVHI